MASVAWWQIRGHCLTDERFGHKQAPASVCGRFCLQRLGWSPLCCPAANPADTCKTCRLLWGIPGRSNALNIAERLGLDAAVVAAAREKMGAAAAEVCTRVCVGAQAGAG
jgi:hypothetical protein